MKRIFWVVLMAVLLCPLGAMAADADVYAAIDAPWNKAYALTYEGKFDKNVMALYKESLDLADKAIAENPNDYELMWRYCRAAAEYTETASCLRDEIPEWKDICREWGIKGFEMGNKACKVNPDGVEAYFWRNYCMGKYALIGGMESIITAVKEGFLPKAMDNAVKGYEIDPTYLDYVTTYAYSMLLTHIPTIPFVTPGNKKSRYKDAMEYYRQHDEHTRDNFQQVFEWDVRCAFTAEFLIEAVNVLKMKGDERAQYQGDARKLCEMGLKSPQKFYRDWCQELLDNPKNWD